MQWQLMVSYFLRACRAASPIVVVLIMWRVRVSELGEAAAYSAVLSPRAWCWVEMVCVPTEGDRVSWIAKSLAEASCSREKSYAVEGPTPYAACI